MSSIPTLPGITSTFVPTARLLTHVLTSGPADGEPVVFVHGNASSSVFWEETMLALPPRFQALAPDLRGYGETEDLLIDATRGAKDWAEDLKALSDTLGDRPAHLIGWSLGAAPVLQFALDYPELVRSITLVAPVSPYGFGGTKDVDGAPSYDDFAGSGGGSVNPEFVRRMQIGDRSGDDANSPRVVINSFYYKPPFHAGREEEFLSSLLLEKTGADRYPGDMTPSANWPTVAPGVRGPINATSPKYLNLSGITAMLHKPPILWIRGDSDQVVGDNSLFDFGTLGMLGAVPGWPGVEVFPPQPMVAQTRAVLDRYAANGGSYQEVVIADAGHSPHIEQPAAFMVALLSHLES
ncbi:MAG: alpha/beta hydrolase [Candidatus Promineofilum sp.]|mgnify:FL=1|nr:alpha/beta hydrolase [Promineifilum sp.]MCW5862003.1 alpha/beta hydrolase [Anaerolineae bacterium]